MAISFEQVAAAADKIRANNTNPTCQNVRETLGTGSMATISKLLRRYKSEQPAAESVSAVTLPETLKKAMYDELERYSAERVSVVRDELNEALQTIESIESESESLEELCSERLSAIEKGAQVLNELTATNDEQARRIRDLLEERASLKALSDSLTLSLAESKASLSSVERERDTAHELNKTHEEKMGELITKNTEQAIETQRLTTINANLDAQQSEKSNALKAAHEALEKKTSELDSEKRKTSSLESKVAVLESQATTLNEYKLEQKKIIEKLESAIQAQKDEHKEEIKRLQAQKHEHKSK